jgi:putative endonuclease
MMFFVYVLRSEKNGKRYVGSTSKTPQERLLEHNSGSNRWTKLNRLLRLIYSEEMESNTESRKRENFLKSGQGRKWLDENIPR